MTRAPVDSARVVAEHEPEFGGWTRWVSGHVGVPDDTSCLMRLLGGPRVFKSEKHALRAGRRWLRERERDQDVSAAGAEEE